MGTRRVNFRLPEALVEQADVAAAVTHKDRTEIVVEAELEETAAYADVHGGAARVALRRRDRLTVHDDVEPAVESTRIDRGEGACAALVTRLDAAFLLTDDLRALPELQTAVDARVAISPVVLRSLVDRGRLDRETALSKLDALVASRDWLGAPIYRRAERLFEGDG